ncbi:Protein kinase and PP2C-like domain-containing protein [Porphyridium purpureum]|uniref:Protein kinase and PP2C-like domain-containing protein n=1 Tax=Porphyridium purpureum TaxID=35688 RepID=A0A5J4Z1S8_PORPP|nr:Protein kinase and PP2C-like domain-containing protein [Porphyridium purpureum]|eukprot:POR2608..scf208_2
MAWRLLWVLSCHQGMVRGAVFSAVGTRYGDLNQDRGFVFDEMVGSEPGAYLLAGVFDGHGLLGDHAAQLAVDTVVAWFQEDGIRRRVHETLCQRTDAALREQQVQLILREVIQQTHERILASYDTPPHSAFYGPSGHFHFDEARHQYVSASEPDDKRPLEFGTTAILAFYDIANNTLYTAQLGDSLAALGGSAAETDPDGAKGTISARMLSLPHAHSARNKTERERVMQERNPVRLALHAIRVGPHVLRITRALGHKHLSIEPEFLVVHPQKNEQVLVLGSDGVFDIIGVEDAVRFCVEFDDPAQAAEELVIQATELARVEAEDSVDNTTAVVIFLD